MAGNASIELLVADSHVRLRNVGAEDSSAFAQTPAIPSGFRQFFRLCLRLLGIGATTSTPAATAGGAIQIRGPAADATTIGSLGDLGASGR